MEYVRSRVALAFGLVLLSAGFTASAVVPAGVARADADCGRVIPYEAVADAVSEDSITGELETTAGLAVAPGGMALSATTVGTGAAAAATFLAAMYGTCRFLDITNWFETEHEAPSPTYGVSTQSAGSPAQCSLGSTRSSWDNGYSCVTVTLGTQIPAYASTSTNRRLWRNNNTTFTLGANSFPGVTYSALYPTPINGSVSGSTDAIVWERPGNGSVCFFSAAETSCQRWTSATHNITIGWWCISGVDSNGATSGGFTLVWDMGGACGQHPGLYTVGYDPVTPDVKYLVDPWPTATEWGWQRTLNADVQCKNGPGGTTTWVREANGPYLDLLPNVRPQMPECPDGYIPTQLVLHRTPTGVECAIGTACFGDDSIITRIQLPPELTEVATAPDWIECLADGNDCGVPEYEGAECSWGSFPVSVEFCIATEQANNGTEARTEVRAQPTVDLGDSPVTDPVATETADPPGEEPPSGVTVNVPIDEGRGEGGFVLDEQEEECWPDGWGWFNPAEWVYRPIKCALVWAFVPDDPGGPIGELQDELETQFPFSLGFLLIDFAATLGDELGDPSGTGCFNMPSSFSFGSFSVPMDDVCIGEGVEPGSTERQLYAALMIAPLLWAICTHAVRTMRGVSTT